MGGMDRFDPRERMEREAEEFNRNVYVNRIKKKKKKIWSTLSVVNKEFTNKNSRSIIRKS